MFHGTITALLTPFKNGTIDEEAYRAHIEWQLEQGVNGVVPCGTTGESATMTHAEHESAIRICIDQVKGRVPVIAGAGSNNTVEAISLTRFAKKAGADAALLISPYYNKPTQEGIFQHFKAINDEVALPMFVYNVPGRTGSNVLPATQARMARELEHVIGCKEATANLVQVSNSSDVAAVKNIFQARIDNMVGTDENPGAAWYPAAIELWDTHSQIVTNGNYVMLIVSENDADIVSDFNALF